jgi:Tfp pilus assembly protein PilW
MVISSIVLMATYRVMIGQSRGYSKQVASTDVDESGRGAAGLLAWELRHAGLANAGPSTLGTNSIALRSIQGTGVICAKHATLPRYGIWKNGGEFGSTTDDSAMVYVAAKQAWRKLKVSSVSSTPSAAGVPSCAWGSRAPDLVLDFTVSASADTLGLKVGSIVRGFRRVNYGEFQHQGRWWMGRRVGSSTTWEKLTGPLLPPTQNGLAFRYFTSTGAVTSTASAVAVVEVSVRTQSNKLYRNRSTAPEYREDSITTKVALRK